MTNFWHPDEDPTPLPRDVELMAATLESRHGTHAAGVAEFFATFHAQQGDMGRSKAWIGVADTVRIRARERLYERN